MNVEQEIREIREQLTEAARRYRRLFRDPVPYATGTNYFVHMAESAWFEAGEPEKVD